MPVSLSRHFLKLSATLSEYVFEGCGVLTAGIEGLRAAFSGNVDGVAQPITLTSNTTSSSSNAGLTGGGKPDGVVRTALARSLQATGVFVRGSSGRGPFHADIVLSLPIAGEVGEGEKTGQRQRDQHARVEQEAHANCPPARSYAASSVSMRCSGWLYPAPGSDAQRLDTLPTATMKCPVSMSSRALRSLINCTAHRS